GRNFSLNRVGSMSCLFFTEKPLNSFESALSSDTGLYAKYFHNMLDSGIYIAPAQFEASFISASHTYQELDTFAEANLSALKAIFQ
ncbi:MAG: glutamate-semialdehyde -aminomutase, partial [Bacteroidota bacterium]|nr:glutamate-semialdehyde -aminomutase [Bacteroidota bacterium]